MSEFWAVSVLGFMGFEVTGFSGPGFWGVWVLGFLGFGISGFLGV